jgi:hypothetical protein|nr:MAG TPA: hypothetical protein [Caudoviricetes sp.]
MMEDKKQDVNSLEELVKIADSYKAFFASLADELSKVFADIKVPEKQEDTWEMKCPYEYGDKHYCIQSNGDIFPDDWYGTESDDRYFSQGNVFQTKQAAELEVKRRNLLTRFRAFRDECNDGWKPDMADASHKKYCLFYSEMKNSLYVSYIVLGTHFHIFSYFKNEEDAERAIELFGQEIKKLFIDRECD